MRKTEMKYMLGLKMRAFPNHKQEAIIKKNTDTARFIYNQLLANSCTDSAIHRNKLDKHYPIPEEYWRYNSKGNVIAKSKKRSTGLDRITADKYPWLADKDLDSLMPYNTQINYQAAWSLFRKVNHAGHPKFKRKSAPKQSYSTNCQYVGLKDNKQSLFNGTVRFIDKKHLKLPKLGNLKVVLSRPLPEGEEIRITKATISHLSSGEYFISLLIKSNDALAETYSKTSSEVGYDLNVRNFLMDTTGHEEPNPKYYQKIKNKLAREQRKLSRRARRAKKEKRKLWQSKNYQKQKIKVAKLHHRIFNQRHSFLDQLSTAYIKNHDLVVGENLKSKNLLKDHALAMSISDVGWRTFIGMLQYKAPLHGKTFVLVNPAYTTQTCYDCKFVMGTNGTKKLTVN
ncbi:putative transposase [Lactobacillus colini]|uniref:Transposase n=1 Tax=Lactobacillus colini TaxID=1819254 RepID=A0ABS4MEL1_9LACO|nr:RNA-guided endonuclease TnpB family protein [Lactobacillus colini]MBP2058063.1 putative transposase [Lactobacillus colini]